AASFVLGALEPAEADAVRAHLAGCPEAHAEVAELGSVAPMLLETVDRMEPPSGLRERILAAAAADTQRAADTQGAADTQRAADNQRVIEVPRRSDTQRGPNAGLIRSTSAFRRPVWAAIGIAAALGLVALGAWNLQLRGQVDQLATYRNAVAAVIDQAAQPGAQLAVLSQSNGNAGPTGLAAVTGGGTTVSMVMRDLAPTTGSEVYEAWLIEGANAPVPIGSFTVDASGTAIFATTARAPSDLSALTLALTREPRAGAITPTLPIIAAGKAAGQSS
ncbi:MAG: anti-sigma factor, partial [Candidatus Limnocylindrales bacterium]